MDMGVVWKPLQRDAGGGGMPGHLSRRPFGISAAATNHRAVVQDRLEEGIDCTQQGGVQAERYSAVAFRVSSKSQFRLSAILFVSWSRN